MNLRFSINVRNLARIFLFLFFLVGLLLNPIPNFVDLEISNLEAGKHAAHIFGCDRLGRDNWAMFSYGSLATVILCIPARLLTLLFAMFISFCGTIRNGDFSFLTDVISSVFLALPSLLVALVAIAILPDNQTTIIVAIVLSDWAVGYETIQGKLREIQKSGYISASSALGAKSFHVFYFHLIPALSFVLEFLFITGIPSVIMTIALFSYLGINTSLLDFGPGLGEQIAFSKDYFGKTPVSVLLPILGIIGLVYSFGRDEK